MNISRNYKTLQKAIGIYEEKLKTYSEEVFQQTPAKGKWSFAEVYSHILTANILSLKGIQKCIEATAEEIPGRIALGAWMLLLIGQIPQGRFKAPKFLEERIKKITKEEAQASIDKMKERLEEVMKGIAKASPTQKIKHPRLGYFNARQWLRFILIHSKHHIKQLSRIEKLLGIN